MNLIEQFGYEAVKAELKDKKWRRDNLHGSAEFTWHIGQHIQLLEAILLQHRRQHNIFEEGDKVVSIDKYSNDMIFTVAELTSKNVFTSMEFGEIAYSFVRHATPEEIKAGKRL